MMSVEGLLALASASGSAVDVARLLEPDMILRILLQVVLLCASAFFSGSEVALFSLSKMDLHRLQRERNRHAAHLYALLEQPRRLIISILCGNEFINVAASANMAAILLSLFDETTAAVLTLVVMVPLLLLFGEVTPKTIAVSDPVRVSTRIIAGPMTVWVKLIAPVRWIVRLTADRLTTLVVGENKAPENILMADEIRTIVDELQESGELRVEERQLVDALLKASSTEVVEIMAPRTRALFVEATTAVPDVLERVRLRRQARVPVYNGHRDNLVGFLHAEDLMALVLEGADLRELPMQSLLHPIVVVPPTKKLDEMLEYFREHHAQSAVVVNEFGGVDGMVSIHSILTFMFDPVSGVVTPSDEYSGPQPGTFDVPGEMKLTTFNDLTNFGIVDPRMTTVGGVVFRHLDRLPQRDDRATVDGIDFMVLEVEEHRIVRVRACRGHAGESHEEATEASDGISLASAEQDAPKGDDA